jgi:hypothetical protein
MNKLHAILLATTLCSMVHGLTASEGQGKRLPVLRSIVPQTLEPYPPFFDDQTKNNFKLAARDYGLCYWILGSAISTHSIGNILMSRDQSLIHRKWMFMPEEYLKHAKGSSRLMNIVKDQGVIGRRLLGTVPKTLPIALITAVIYDGYQKSISQQ